MKIYFFILHFSILFVIQASALPTGNEISSSQIHNRTLNHGIYEITMNGSLSTDITHVLLQVHSPLSEIILSYQKSDRTSHNSITGTSVGLVTLCKDQPNPVWYIDNNSTDPINIFIIITTYTADKPIPGGCNFELSLPDEPNLKFSTLPVMNNGMRHLQFALGGLWQSSDGQSLMTCEGNINLLKSTRYHLYQMDIYPADYSVESQMKVLQDLYSPETVLARARLVATWLPMTSSGRINLPIGHLSYRQGRGVASVLIMEKFIDDQSTYAAYVTNIDYGYLCGPQYANLEDCLPVSAWWWRVSAGIGALMGLFLCLAGHRFFTASVWLVGIIFGALISAILFLRFTDLQDWEVCVCSLLGAGLGFGFLWLAIWHWGRAPTISLLSHVAIIGFFLMCILLFFTPLNQALVWKSVPSYLFSLVLIALILFIDLLFGCCLRVTCSIIASALVGSYMLIYFISAIFLQGSMFPYILQDTIMRYLSSDYLSAVYYVNYNNSIDIVLLCSWAALFLLGILVQFLATRKRPSFPSFRIRQNYDILHSADSGRAPAPPANNDMADAPWRPPPAENPNFVSNRVYNDRTPLLRTTRSPPPLYTR